MLSNLKTVVSCSGCNILPQEYLCVLSRSICHRYCQHTDQTIQVYLAKCACSYKKVRTYLRIISCYLNLNEQMWLLGEVSNWVVRGLYFFYQLNLYYYPFFLLFFKNGNSFSVFLHTLND